MPEIELKPCPFCGGEAITRISVLRGTGGLKMNEKYVKLSDVKKNLNYIYRAYGVSQKIKQTISSALKKIPYTMVGELEVALEAEPVNHGVQKVLKNDLQQCISSFERMKKGGVGIADELVYQTCKRALEYIEKLDVEPVKYGHWVYDEFGTPHCSECGKEIKPNDVSPFCPNCGAKMEGGV